MEDTKKIGLMISLLLCLFVGLFEANGQTYNVKEVTLNNSTTSSKIYNAREKIVLNPGFSFDATTGGKTFVGNIDESLTFDADYNPTPSDASSSREIDYNLPVGSIPGSLNVSPTGAAVYTVPIDIAPGTNGMQPDISVVYNSQSGNGLVGWGWNLSCVSAITRVGKNKYYDGTIGTVNLDNEDRLMLDGQRLMLINGTYCAGGSEYKTEQDNFAKITSSGNIAGAAASYLVWTKDGHKYYYDKAVVIGSGKQPYMYLLSKVEDRNGNYMVYNYTTNASSNETVLSSIEYTGTTAFAPYNKVEFFYDIRQDKRMSYLRGVKTEQTQILRKIKVTCEGEHVRSYEFKYVFDGLYSKLNEIYLYGTNGEMLNPITINYGEIDSICSIAYKNIRHYYRDIEEYDDGISLGFGCMLVDYQTGDFNNDGISDIVLLYDAVRDNNERLTNRCFKVFLGNSRGGYQQEPFFEQIYHIHRNNIIDRNTIIRIADMNNDGWDDIFVCQSKTGDGYTNLLHDIGTYIRTPWGDHLFEYYAFQTDDLTLSQEKHRKIINLDLADFDNNGLIDVIVSLHMTNQRDAIDIFMVTGYTNNTMTYDKKTLISDIKGNPPKFDLVDFNGNGKVDIMLSVDNSEDFTYVNEYVNGQFVNIKNLGYPSYWHKSYYGDFNGDGYTDILAYCNGTWEIMLNNGLGDWNWGESSNVYPCPIVNTTDPTYLENKLHPVYYTIDVNFDGLCDIVEFIPSFFGAAVYLYISTGYGFDIFSDGSNMTHPIKINPRIEINQFGEISFIYTMTLTGETNKAYESLSINIGHQERLVEKINNTDFIKIDYANCREVCEIIQENKPSLVNRVVPFMVVHTTQFGKNNIFTYRYGTPVVHLHGKGLLGFNNIVINNTVEKINSKLEYAISPFYTPYIGSKSTFMNEVLLSKSIFYHNFITPYSNKKIFVDLDYKTDEFDYAKNILGQTWIEFFDNNHNPKVTHKKIFNIGSNDPYYIEKIEVPDDYLSNGSWCPYLAKKITKTSKTKDQLEVSSRIEYVYDGVGNVLQEKTCFDKVGNTEFDYTTYYNNYVHGLNNQIILSNSLGQRSTFLTYDSKYRVKTGISNHFGHTKLFKYDYKRGNLLYETDEDGRMTLYTYDGLGNLVKKENSSGEITEYQKGWSKNLSQADVPESPTKALVYTKTSALGGGLEYKFYDIDGLELRRAVRQSEKASAPWLYYDNFYRENGQLTRSYQPYASNESKTLFTQYMYYGFGINNGRLYQELFPDGSYTNYVYDGLTTTTTHVAGDVTRRKVQKCDPIGAVIQVTDDVGTINYTYTSKGELSSISYGENNFVFKYDKVGNRIELHDPAAGLIKSKYNAWGEIISSQSAQQAMDGTFYKMNYDGIGRLTSKQLLKGSYSSQTGTQIENYQYTYGASNSILGLYSETSKSGRKIYSYDLNGRISNVEEQVLNSGGGIEKRFQFNYEYDNYGRLTAKNYPNGLTITNSYDQYGYRNKINGHNGKQLYETQSYNKHGMLSDYTLGNNLNVSKGFDDKGRLTSILATSGSTLYHSLEYGYHADGNISYRADKYYGSNSIRCKEWFEYDVMSRLTGTGLTTLTAASCANYDKRMIYDGNRLVSKTGIGSYQYGGVPVNAVKQIVNGTNSLLNPNDCNITYTSFQKTLSITEGDKLLTYTYGVDDDRVKSVYSSSSGTITKYYAGSGTYEEIIENNVTKYRYYIMGNDGALCMYEKTSANNAFKLYYIMKDHLGSVVSLVEDNNNVYTTRARYSYDAWGRRRNDRLWDSYSVSSSTLGFTDRGFCGHEHLDGFKLINMTGRVYDPLLGVFLSPDPYVQSTSSTQGLNRYAYCMNNPVMYIDPDGELAWFIIPIAIGVINSVVQVAMNPKMNAIQAIATFGINIISSLVWGQIGAAIAPYVAVSSSPGFGGQFANGLVNGSIVGTASSAMSGDDNPLLSGLISGLTAGFINGLEGGIKAVKHGGRFWNGDGMTVDLVVQSDDNGIISKHIKTEPGIDYNNDFVRGVAAKEYPHMQDKNVEIFADGRIPQNSKYDYEVRGDYVVRNQGTVDVLGTSTYNAQAKRYEIYIYKLACETMNRLVSTLGHEYLHVAYWITGSTLSGDEIHAQITHWQMINSAVGDFNYYRDLYMEYIKYYKPNIDVTPNRLGFYKPIKKIPLRGLGVMGL